MPDTVSPRFSSKRREGQLNISVIPKVHEDFCSYTRLTKIKGVLNNLKLIGMSVIKFFCLFEVYLIVHLKYPLHKKCFSE